MAHIVVLGAGIGGMPAACELRESLGTEHRIAGVNATDHFSPSPVSSFVFSRRSLS